MAVVSAETAGIRATGLTKSYGSVHAVRGIDLVIAPGETVALLGPNGAGKTTIVDMFLGLTRPDGGRVFVFGASPTDAVSSGWVGAMSQSGSLPDHLRVRELVTLMASYYPHPLRVDDVLDQTGTADIERRWTNNLSGGQAQRVRVAAALVSNPDLLVLDEPTAGIDVEGRREIWRAIGAVAERGKTVLFATHYLEEADANADRIVLIARGEIVADGPGSEIKAKVGSRTVRATLPGVELAGLRALPGVLGAERHGEAVTLSCSDTDAALGALFGSFPAVRDVEVRGASLEEAFLELTGDEHGDRDAKGEASRPGNEEPR
jgi:ABC-2 type transport system ATP-binding protein